ncbi:hypothetical protein ACFX1W_005357 [Malus domestica]
MNITSVNVRREVDGGESERDLMRKKSEREKREDREILLLQIRQSAGLGLPRGSLRQLLGFFLALLGRGGFADEAFSLQPSQGVGDPQILPRASWPRGICCPSPRTSTTRPSREPRVPCAWLR